MIDQDDDVYGLVRDGFQPVRMAGDLDAVTARGGVLRRRRRVALPAAAGLAVTALAAAVTLSVGGAPAIEPVAWSVETGPDGTVTLTVRELSDADGLRARLESAGIAARVDFRPAGSPDCARQREGLPAMSQVMGRGEGPGVFRIDPSAMPAGTTLHFIVVAGADGTVSTVRAGLYEGEPPRC